MYQKWQSYDVWFLKYRARWTEFFVILDYFLFFALLYTLNNLKNQNFEKMKKTHRDTFYTSVPKIMIICYTVLEIWLMTCNFYFSFWAIFCPFTPPTAQKLRIFKKWEKPLEISLFYISVPKIMFRWYTVPEIWCATDRWMEKVTYRGRCPT